MLEETKQLYKQILETSQLFLCYFWVFHIYFVQIVWKIRVENLESLRVGEGWHKVTSFRQLAEEKSHSSRSTTKMNGILHLLPKLCTPESWITHLLRALKYLLCSTYLQATRSLIFIQQNVSNFSQNCWLQDWHFSREFWERNNQQSDSNCLAEVQN